MPQKQSKNTAIHNITENDWNPNEMDRAAFDALVASIEAGHPIKPILVRETGDEPPYQIVDGAHTFQAAVQAGLKTVPVLIFEGTASDAILETFARNTHGEMNPLRSGVALDRMEGNVSNGEVAKRIGKSEGTVRNWRMYSELYDVLVRDLQGETPRDAADRDAIFEAVAALKVKEMRDLASAGDAAQDGWRKSVIAATDDDADASDDTSKVKLTKEERAAAKRHKAMLKLTDAFEAYYKAHEGLPEGEINSKLQDAYDRAVMLEADRRKA